MWHTLLRALGVALKPAAGALTKLVTAAAESAGVGKDWAAVLRWLVVLAVAAALLATTMLALS